MGFKITAAHLWVATEDNGTEGIPAFSAGLLMLPLIAADPDRLKSLEPRAAELAIALGKPLIVARLQQREDVAIVCPRCGRTSWNPGDVLERYCGHCRVHHDQR